MRVRILRQKSPFSEPYWEGFIYDGPEDNTIAGVLDYINYNDDIVNDKGEKTGRIGWECSCFQGLCGVCAMVINEKPALACTTFLRDFKGDVIEIRPLRKFPTVSDLVVDRTGIQENLKGAEVYISEHEEHRADEYEHQYAASKCLKCGLCLEVCPNYGSGVSFYGAAFANDCYLAHSGDSKRKNEIKTEYDEHFAGSCSKSLSCMEVCPMEIPTIASMAKMNRSKRKK